MAFCFGLLRTRGSNHFASQINLAILFSMLCMLTSVDSWSYNYSETTMDWSEARNWCRQHYTDMVAIQNQGEIKHLNSWLPFKKGYYWIGIRKINDVWTWVGTNKTLTPEATNWAKNEPNNGKNKVGTGISEDCVEMYIRRQEETGKWNDERCNKPKTALCYTAACKIDSCLHGECVETIDSHECNCYKGFYGEMCEKVVECNKDEVTAPANGGVNCIHKYGNFSYDSECSYSCEEGYNLSMSRPLRCTEDKTWSEQRPTCELVQCPKLSPPESGSMKRSDPLGHSSYQSTRVFTCDEGYELAGSPSNTLQCEASGKWNASTPSCVLVECNKDEVTAPANGGVNCIHKYGNFSYDSECSYSCEEGYNLSMSRPLRCTEDKTWSEQRPTCELVQCPKLSPPESGSMKRSDPLGHSSYQSTRVFTCDEGYELAGSPSNTLQCEASGKWNASTPSCVLVECNEDEVTAPANGSVNCIHKYGNFSYDSECSYSCEEGYNLSMSRPLRCTEDKTWSEQRPTCESVQCPALQLENGTVSCGDNADIRFSYGITCSFRCVHGYNLMGPSEVTCTSAAKWSEEMPRCEAPASQITTIASSVAAGGALSLSALSLAIWILKRMKQKATKFELNSTSDIEAPLQTYKSSIDSLI